MFKLTLNKKIVNRMPCSFNEFWCLSGNLMERSNRLLAKLDRWWRNSQCREWIGREL